MFPKEKLHAASRCKRETDGESLETHNNEDGEKKVKDQS